MPKEELDPQAAYMMAPRQQLAEQAPRYNMGEESRGPPTVPANSPPFYPVMPSAPPPSQPSQAPPTQIPADPLEQRILDLIYPYRDDPFNADVDNALDEERKILMLCGLSSSSSHVTFTSIFTLLFPTSRHGTLICL